MDVALLPKIIFLVQRKIVRKRKTAGANSCRFALQANTMIVKQSNEGWLLIYQASHGLLAGKIANELSYDLRPNYWIETLTAITEHDDHQLRFDEKMYLNEIGSPVDFTENNTPEEKALERAKRIYNQARIKSGYTAMLVAMHLEFLYGSSANARMDTFLKKLKKEREESKKLYNIEDKEANEVYELLRFCDRCSLILCKDQLPSLERALEINTSIGGKTFHIKKIADNQITVDPWLFEKDTFKLEVEQVLLKTPYFEDNIKLKKALDAAGSHLVHWTFKKY